MLKRTKVCFGWVGVLLGLYCSGVNAQPTASEDAIIRPIQPMSTIGGGDQRRIGDWVRNRVEELIAAASLDEPGTFSQFRKRVGKLYRDPINTQAFKSELTVQVTRIAAQMFADGNLHVMVARALARVLVDMGGAGTYAGLIAGLRSKDQSARYLCARELTSLQSNIMQDRARLDQTVAALRQAGEVEHSPVVLSRIYLALAYPGQVEAVFDAYMALFDKRLEYRRGSAVLVDRAEADAFDYFRQSAVIAALNADQKSTLAGRLAVFLSLDARRYSTANLGIEEREHLERRLDGLEACLEELVGTAQGGDIRGELKAGAYERREAALQQAYRWIGNPTTQTPGALNTAPWNVPIGAP